MNTVVVLQYAPLITGAIVLGAAALVIGGAVIAWIALNRY